MRFIGKFTSFKNMCSNGVACYGLTPVFLLLLSTSLHAANAADVSGTPADTLHYNDSVSIFTENILFPKASAVVYRDFAENNAAIDSICRFFSIADIHDFINVKVTGAYSPEGKYRFNNNLAEARAHALAGLVREINPDVNPEISISRPTGQNSDYPRMRYAELRIVYRNNASADNALLPETDDPLVFDNIAATDAQSTDSTIKITPPGDLNTYQSDTYTESSENGQSPERKRHNIGRRVFVTTNMLYDAALTPNIGVGISVGDRVTVQADWMYARWSNHDRRRYWRIYGGDAEVRFRIGPHRKGSPLGGHYAGVYGSIACYDFQAGRSHSGVLSDKYNYAAGISYTYSLPVSTHFNIDFNLGVGYLWGTYKKHIPIDDCDVWLSTHKLGWFGPTRLGVTLVWLVGNGIKNTRERR